MAEKPLAWGSASEADSFSEADTDRSTDSVLPETPTAEAGRGSDDSSDDERPSRNTGNYIGSGEILPTSAQQMCTDQKSESCQIGVEQQYCKCFSRSFLADAVGEVPLQWYKDEEHIGYDREGAKIAKQKRRDRLEALLARNDSSKDWRTIYDEFNDEEITLSKDELQLLQRIREGQFPHIEVSWCHPSCSHLPSYLLGGVKHWDMEEVPVAD